MRITIVQGAFFPIPPLLGGAVEKLWYRLGREFAKAGHEVTHLSCSHPTLPNQEIEGGVRYIRVKGGKFTNNIPLLKLRDFIYTWRLRDQLPKADVLISNTFWLPILARDSSLGTLLVSVERMPKGQMRFYGGNSILRANSQAVHEAILAELPSAAKRIITLPNPLPFDPPERVDLSAKESVILFAGRIHPEKGLDLLMEAARSLPEGWILDVVGPHQISAGGGGEEYLASLKQKAEGLPVLFSGPLHGINELAERYRRSRVFVYPSIAEAGETFGLAVLEAMAWGCVPIVSDLACFRDFVHHRANGVVFDHRGPEAPARLASLISEVTGNRILSDQFATQALDVRVTHSPKEVSRLFLEEFDRMVGSHRENHRS